MQLYTPTEINQTQQDLPYLIEIMEWVKSFLARPHPHLGRSGPVCPFVPQAIKSNSIQFAVVRAKNMEPQQVEEIVLRYRDIFLETEPRQGEAALSKAFLLIFPDIDIEDTPKLIDGVQQKLKPFFVDLGLMLGEFHKRNQTPGLHNQNFRPLQSPIPILAIRYMVESDLPFLQNTDNPRLCIKYIEAYLKRFSQGFKDETKLHKALEVLVRAQEQLKQENLVY